MIHPTRDLISRADLERNLRQRNCEPSCVIEGEEYWVQVDAGKRFPLPSPTNWTPDGKPLYRRDEAAWTVSTAMNLKARLSLAHHSAAKKVGMKKKS